MAFSIVGAAIAAMPGEPAAIKRDPKVKRAQRQLCEGSWLWIQLMVGHMCPSANCCCSKSVLRRLAGFTMMVQPPQVNVCRPSQDECASHSYINVELIAPVGPLLDGIALKQGLSASIHNWTSEVWPAECALVVQTHHNLLLWSLIWLMFQGAQMNTYGKHGHTWSQSRTMWAELARCAFNKLQYT